MTTFATQYPFTPKDSYRTMTPDIPSPQPFIDQLKKYGRLSPEAESDLTACVRCVVKPKGSCLIRQGQTIPNFYVIRQGMLRSFLRREDGEEVTLWFAYEGQQFAAISSFFDRRPSHETIECLEDCELLYIEGRDLNALYLKHNDLNTIGRKVVEDYCKVLDERIFAMQTLSAEQRYRDLTLYHPEVIRRVSLGHIASFLGISQETLSRVRRRTIL